MLIKANNDDILLLLIRYMLKDGLDKNEISKRLEISVKKISQLLKKADDNLNELSYMKLLTEYEVEDALLKKALGGKVTEIKETQKPGGVETVKITKDVPGDTQALQFWLKNKYPKKWSDKGIIQSNTDEVLDNIFNEISSQADERLN